MSNTSENNVSACANCGKGEEAGINLKTCTACKLVKYCSRECQIAHRPQHKKACRKRAAELFDEKLFKQPSQLYEDCPICMIRLPTLITGRTYMNCCGKVICCGCIYAFKARTDRRKGLLCPLCRTLASKSQEETRKKVENRADLNDPIAICDLGSYHNEGQWGLPQNHAKALELWHRAAELGSADAYYNIGIAHDSGSGVERDETKANHYYELAAMGGDPYARHNLGAHEARAGNWNRALKHWVIAAKDGDTQSLNNIKDLYIDGNATKDDYEETLCCYQLYVDEIKTDERDKAAIHHGNSYY